MKLCFAGRISNQSLCARLKSAKGFLKQNFSNQSLCTRLKSAKGFHTAARQGRPRGLRRQQKHLRAVVFFSAAAAKGPLM